MLILSINIVNMLQVKSFEKIILTSYDITYVTELRVPPIRSQLCLLPFIFIGSLHNISTLVCIDCIAYLIAFQTKQILSSYLLFFVCHSSLNTETPYCNPVI